MPMAAASSFASRLTAEFKSARPKPPPFPPFPLLLLEGAFLSSAVSPWAAVDAVRACEPPLAPGLNAVCSATSVPTASCAAGCAPLAVRLEWSAAFRFVTLAGGRASRTLK